MKRIPTLALLTLAALLPIPGAQAQGVVLKADIPFGFSVGKTALPAGTYTISSPSAGIVRIANQDRDIEAAVPTIHGYGDPGHASKLVFDKLGKQYFLRHVLCPTVTSLNVDVPDWGAEKRVRALETAKLEPLEQVFIATR